MDGSCKPKCVGVSYIYKILSFYCCAVFGISIVKSESKYRENTGLFQIETSHG